MYFLLLLTLLSFSPSKEHTKSENDLHSIKFMSCPSKQHTNHINLAMWRGKMKVEWLICVRRKSEIHPF